MPRKEGYERVSERAERGEYDLIAPLDYRILDLLPPEGTTFADLYPVGTTARDMTSKIKGLTIPICSTRMLTMRKQGLVQKVKLIGDQGDGSRGGSAWQITPRGEKLLKEWKDSRGDDVQ